MRDIRYQIAINRQLDNALTDEAAEIEIQQTIEGPTTFRIKFEVDICGDGFSLLEDERLKPGDPDTEDDETKAVTLPCEVVLLDRITDREEGVVDVIPGDPGPPIVSPAPPDPPPNAIPFFELCFETSVIRFGAPMAVIPEETPETEILGSVNFHNVDNEVLGYEYGWMQLEMVDYSHDSDGDGDVDDLRRDSLGGLAGLPVTGFAVMTFQNGLLENGVLANYGGIFQHKGTRLLSD